MPELYKGKICCRGCRHLIDTEKEFKEHCPYCGRRLAKEEREYWEAEERARELRQRRFESN